MRTTALARQISDDGLFEASVADSEAFRPRFELVPPADFDDTARAAPHEVAFRRGYMLAKGGQKLRAIAAFREAAKLKPDFGKAHNNLGVLLVEEDRLSDAIAAFREAVNSQLNWAEAHYCLGWALDKNGDRAEAIAAFREAVNAEPQWAKARHALGVALMKNGQCSEGLVAFREATNIEPEWPWGHYGLGWALTVDEQSDQAVAAFREAIRCAPNNAIMHYGVAVALINNNNYQAAIDALFDGIGIDPEFAEAYHLLGQAYVAIDNFARATLAYASALEVAKTSNEQRLTSNKQRLIVDIAESQRSLLLLLTKDIDVFNTTEYSSDPMDKAKAKAAAAAMLTRAFPAEHVEKAFELLEDLAAAETTIRESTTARVTETARPEASIAPAPVAPRPVTAEELFGNIPAALQSKPRQKYVFTPDLLDNPEAFKTAQGVANSRNYKLRMGIELTQEDDVRGLMANSFVNQARSRRRRREAEKPSPG
jgi:tetratricopeptide (TPR) repeat protein